MKLGLTGSFKHMSVYTLSTSQIWVSTCNYNTNYLNNHRCQYRGDQDAIDSHLKECKYEGVKVNEEKN